GGGGAGRGSVRRRPGRLRGAARPSARAGAPAEGGSALALDPGAGGAVSRLHPRGAAAAHGGGGRLSGDGRLARLPEVAPAAAGAAVGGRAVGGRPGGAAAIPARTAGRDPACQRTAHGAAAARPGGV